MLRKGAAKVNAVSGDTGGRVAGIGDALFWQSSGKPVIRGGVTGSAVRNQVRSLAHDQRYLTKRLHLTPRLG